MGHTPRGWSSFVCYTLGVQLTGNTTNVTPIFNWVNFKGAFLGSAHVYHLFAYARFLTQAQFFIVYKPIVSKLPIFARK